MTVKQDIKQYIGSQPEGKKADLETRHKLILKIDPNCKLWFVDGKNSEGKVVSNPNIGYGTQLLRYADGTIREFYKVGISANKTGISVYILGIRDKTYLPKTYAKDIGKASVTGYCIKFKTLQDINVETLEAAIRYGFEATAA